MAKGSLSHCHSLTRKHSSNRFPLHVCMCMCACACISFPATAGRSALQKKWRLSERLSDESRPCSVLQSLDGAVSCGTKWHSPFPFVHCPFHLLPFFALPLLLLLLLLLLVFGMACCACVLVSCFHPPQALFPCVVKRLFIARGSLRTKA